VTAQPILEALAKEFSTDVPSIQATFEMLDAGLSAPFIGKFRRGRTGALSEVHVRRLALKREELVELDRRRGTILRAMERVEGISPKAIDEVNRCMDRFRLEDLYVPHRRPEPEVQLAMDRGLGGLADLLVAPMPKSERPPSEKGSRSGKSKEAPEESPEAEPTEAAAGAPADGSAAAPDDAPIADAEPDAEPDAEAAVEPPAPGDAASIEVEPGEDRPPTVGHDAKLGDGDPEGAPEEEAAAAAEETAAEETAAEEAAAEQTAADAPEPEAAPADSGSDAAPTEETPGAPGEAAAPDQGAEAPAAATDAPAAAPEGAPAAQAQPAPTPSPQPEALIITAELSKLCAPFVNPDKGVHTETEALAGAVRILSDRLGRDSRLRDTVRRVMRKKGVLRARALVDDKKAGRHKNLLKLKTPLRQLQGHRLTAIRQAQSERVISTSIELHPSEVVGRVRAALGKHTRPEYEPLLDDIARKALAQRILPVIEEDIRLELKERSDAEALRFLGAHLRQILLTPFFGRVPVAGLDVSAKGDLTLAFLGVQGDLAAEVKIEVGEKEPAAIGAEVAAAVEQHGATAIAVGSGKSSRAAGHRLREALSAANAETPVMVVNDAGASSYANGTRARAELAECSIGLRLAISIGRRLQDPMAEFLKVDPKQLSLGAEQRLVSKANLRRVLQDAVESAVAFVGCDFDTAPRSIIEHLPGLDEESAKRLADRRDAGDIESREAIRAEGILDEAQWTSVAAFLRMRRSSEPLDRTSLHPEQYQLARQLLESSGGSVAESLGRPGATKGLRRQSFDVDEFTWRDLMRELSFPGRDPRGRNHVPEYISESTDPIRLQPGRVITGVVTNVASFGAFVDVGKKQDAMIHISQLASRYIRDARELLSIGATIRAKIVEGNSSRLALSLKDVPNEERQDRGARRRGGSTRRRGGGRGARGSDQPTGPAGRIWRRDGAAGAATSSRRGTRRGGPRRGGRDEGRFERGERVDLRKINAQSDKLSSNPFAQFFKQDDGPPNDPKPAKKKGPKGKKADAGPGPDVAAGQEPVAPQQEPPTSGAQPQGTETPGED
jgi:uncharacterized protein